MRWYTPAYYAAAVKILAESMRPNVTIPPEGLGAPNGTTPGDKAVKAIKLMCVHNIQIATLDEAGALDGTRLLSK